MTRATWLIVCAAGILSTITAYAVRTCLSCWWSLIVQLSDRHQGFLLAFFTLALVIVTAIYVWLTREILRSQREPAMAVYLTPSERWPNTIDFVIKNWGGGTAREVRWNLNGNEQTRARYDRLFVLDLFQRVSDFPPGQEIRSFLGTGPSLLQDPVPPPAIVTATYRGQFTAQRSETFTLDVMLLANLAPNRMPEAEMADHLEHIEDATRQIATSIQATNPTRVAAIRAIEDISQSFKDEDNLRRFRTAVEDIARSLKEIASRTKS